ncbi:hypothetical protein PsorP6_018950 [Peronosclerospora sorghi]|nr:hypothetical protein PsorP6_018950 [Peronosclerospora sorghi]
MAESAVKRGRDAGAPVTGAHKKKSGASASGTKRWTPEQDEALKQAVADLGHRNWMAVAERVPGRDNAQCLQRWNKVLKPGLVKGPWSVEEDARLMEMMLKGYDNWRQVSNNIPGRTAKQCRERWRNRLDPSIKKTPFTPQEDEAIQQAYEKYGNRWTQIAELLPGRTEDAVKLRWKALNPNQKTYTKLGRPRLLTLEDGPAAAVSTSPKRPEASDPPPANELCPTKVNLEPILDPLEDEQDERMSQEDVMILNELLRSQSSTSLGTNSFQNLDVADALEPSLEETDKGHRLKKMLSLGDTSSASLRSLTADVEPDEAWINGGLTHRLSGLSMKTESLLESLDGHPKPTTAIESFDAQLAALNDAGSLLLLPLDEDKADEKEATTFGALLDEHVVRTSTEQDIITAQEFYNPTFPHDQLATAQHYEI